jgi:hypothetical protein|eukprot:COSAG06_NODE_36669_length_444_cov_0.895652_1_plen_88_part_00
MLDVFLYVLDQRQMDRYAEPREIPQIRGGGGGEEGAAVNRRGPVEVVWVEDRDERSGVAAARRSKAIWIDEYKEGKERERMHASTDW